MTATTGTLRNRPWAPSPEGTPQGPAARVLAPRTKDGHDRTNHTASWRCRGSPGPVGPVPDAAQPPRGGFHPHVHARWGSQPGLALKSLDWAPGTGDEKLSLCQDPSTGIVGGPRFLQKHQSLESVFYFQLVSPRFPHNTMSRLQQTTPWPASSVTLSSSPRPDSKSDGPPVPSLGSGDPRTTPPIRDTSASNQNLPRGPVLSLPCSFLPWHLCEEAKML